jgi:hypothetical protein
MPDFKIAPGRATQREYDNDFNTHQSGIRDGNKKTDALAAEVAALKKELASLQTSLSRVSNIATSQSRTTPASTPVLTGTVGETQGGTGITTYTAGDMLYADAVNSLTNLPIGSALQLLRTNAGADAPEWFTPGYAPLAWTLTTQTVNYAVPDSYYHVRGDATGGNITVTLPASAGREGELVSIVKVDVGVNTVTVAPAGADTLGAVAGVLATQWASLTLIAVTGAWEVL